jgi:dihydrofolate synthase/folylpolyglutamate synthase
LSTAAILDRLTRLHPVAIDFSLERIRRLMVRLGAPQERLAPVVHVAGTNGKGSTVAFLRAIAEAAGLRAHVYISPHLVRFNERIRLAGRLIDDGALETLLDEVERANAGEPITFFEITTAAAFLAFARVPADLVILETGLGGRLDATNLVDRPAACALTPISFDHMQHLGDTLAKIAGEKAGIIKPGVPAVIGPQTQEAARVFDDVARSQSAPLFRAGKEWRGERHDHGWRYVGRRGVDLPMPVLAGAHQIDNAGLAIAVTENLAGFAFSDAQLSAGLLRAEWPARLQLLTRGPLKDRVGTRDLYLDGGHNEAAGVVIADWARARGGRLDVIFGMLSTKQPAAYLAHLAPHIARLRCVTIPDEPLALPADDLVTAARTVGIADAMALPSIAKAVAELAEGTNRALLICGSLYLAGQVLRDNR